MIVGRPPGSSVMLRDRALTAGRTRPGAWSPGARGRSLDAGFQGIDHCTKEKHPALRILPIGTERFFELFGCNTVAFEYVITLGFRWSCSCIARDESQVAVELDN